LSNRYSPLTCFYNKIAARPRPPPSPINQIVSPSSQITSKPFTPLSNAAKYFQKSLTIPIEPVESEYGPPTITPRQVANSIFPLNCHFVPEGFKT